MSSQAFEILSETADITKCPTPRREKLLGSIAIGDLQGNALRLWYTLIREGIVDVKPGQDRNKAYQNFILLYNCAHQLIQDNSKTICKLFGYRSRDKENQQVTEIKTLNNQLLIIDFVQRYKKILVDLESNLAAWQVVHTKILIRFMGNELASEGAFDGFILAILGLLYDAKVRTVHYASPNSMAFVSAAKRGFNKVNDSIVKAEDKPSLIALLFCFNSKKKIKEVDFPILKKIERYYEIAYLHRLNILDYALNLDGSIVVYSHAPIPFITLNALAKRLDVTYQDSSASLLADTIDAINQAYRKYLIEAAPGDIEDDFHDYDKASLRASTLGKLLKKTRAYPMVSCMKNAIPATPIEKDRDTTEPYIDWTEQYFSLPDRLRYPVYFAHGHAQWPEQLAKPVHVYGLNRDFGMYSHIRPDAESKRFKSVHIYGKQTMDYAVFHHKINSPYEIRYSLAKGIMNAALVSLSAIVGALVAGVSLYVFNPAILLAPFLGTILVGAVVGLCLGILLYCTVRFFTQQKSPVDTKMESTPIPVEYHAQSDSPTSSQNSLSFSSQSTLSRSSKLFKAVSQSTEASSSSQIYDSDTDKPSII